jgi:hypothetical protein
LERRRGREEEGVTSSGGGGAAAAEAEEEPERTLSIFFLVERVNFIMVFGLVVVGVCGLQNKK